MMFYKAPWDRTLKVVSFLTTVILLAVAAMPSPGLVRPVRIVSLALLVGALPFVVRGYEIRDDVLLIRRLFWNTRIDLAGLQSAHHDSSLFCHSLRTCGNGWLYPFY